MNNSHLLSLRGISWKIRLSIQVASLVPFLF